MCEMHIYIYIHIYIRQITHKEKGIKYQLYTHIHTYIYIYIELKKKCQSVIRSYITKTESSRHRAPLYGSMVQSFSIFTWYNPELLLIKPIRTVC